MAGITGYLTLISINKPNKPQWTINSTWEIK